VFTNAVSFTWTPNRLLGQVSCEGWFGELSIMPKADEVYHPGQIVDRFHDPRLLSKSQPMSHKQQTTLFGIVFWTLLLASVGLVGRYQWLQRAWAFVLIGFLVVGAVCSIVDMYRNRRYSDGNVYYLPHWMMWVVLDDEQYDKYLHRRRLTAPDKEAC
jgi:hypothetical protein